MADVIFLAITVAFFALAAAYVRGCARIIGPDATPGPELVDDGQPVDERTAGVR